MNGLRRGRAAAPDTSVRRRTSLAGAQNARIDLFDYTIEIGEERDRVVVIGVARTEEQGDAPAANGAGQSGNRRFLVIELLVIPLSELRPPCGGRVVIEPAAQGHT